MTLAELVVVLHFAFIAFVVTGGLLVLRWPQAAWAHIPAVAWGALIQFVDGTCPLTYLEDALRDDVSAPGGFIDRFLTPIVYPDLIQEGILTPTFRIALGCGVVGINVVVYGAALWRHRRRKPAAREVRLIKPMDGLDQRFPG